MTVSAWWAQRAVVLACALALAACAGGDTEGSGREGGSSGGARGGDDPFQNAPGTAGSDAPVAPGFDNGTGASSAPGAQDTPTMVDLMTDDGACGASSIEAEQVVIEETIEVEEEVHLPLDIYMIVDDSGSMVPWWPGTLDAINMFFADPASAGIGVGVQFFGSSCNAADYATPRVAIAELPGNTTALQGAFPLIPVEGTATVPAMQGAIQHARSWSDSHPDHKVAVLLVTDGLPDDCGSTVQGVVDVVAEGYTGTPSIPTFVVGLGFDLTALNMFAEAGGSGQATLVAPGAATELLNALQDIRDTVVETRIETVEKTVETPLECEWVIPDNPGAGVFDREKVNVQLSAGAGEQTPQLGKVPSDGECAAGGWHFDDADAPTRIIACPQTCDTIQSTTMAKVDILLGCKTIPLE